MDPKLALDLSKNRKIKIFMEYLLPKIQEFNSLDGMEKLNVEETSIEVKARKLAFEKVKEIIKPILEVQGKELRFNKNDYLT